jgi:hypothetical protein
VGSPGRALAFHGTMAARPELTDGGRIMDPPVRQSQNTLSFHWDKLCAPLCAQCRSRMTIVLCEPDFQNSIVATYRCAECGLLDREQIQ